MMRVIRTGTPVGFRGGFIDSLFDEMMSPCGMPKVSSIRSDVKETEKAYIVEAELPGFDKKNINIKVDDGVVTISATVGKDSDKKDDNYACKERYRGSVSRSYGFGSNVIDAENIKAKYENGVLIVEIPKLVEDKKVKEINID